MRNLTTLTVLTCAALLPVQAASGGEIRFVDVTTAAGLREPLANMLGHGAAWGDIDRDGDADLFFGAFADRPDADYAPRTAPPPNALLINGGDGTFTVVEKSPAASYARTSGAVFADLDNDGWPELFVGNNAKGKARKDRGEIQGRATVQRSQLFKNESGKLIDVSAASGAGPDRLLTARNIGVFDYDLDGLLDLFVVEDRFTKSPRSTLYRNLGGLRFKDVTVAAGLPEDIFGLGLAVSDLNGDGRADFFVGHSNRFFLSDGDGTYSEPASLRETFAWKPLHNEDWPCGAAFGDLNRDGKLDLVLAIHGEPARNRIFLNRGADSKGTPQFEDVTQATGLPEQWPKKCPHVEIQDFDNDGWPDLYFSGAWLGADGTIAPLVYRNLGGEAGGVPRFAAPEPPENTETVYFPAGPTADYDNDGRVDLFLVNWFAGNHSRLLRNNSQSGGWLRVRLRSAGKENREGIGSKVTLRSGDKLVGHGEITTGYGYASGQIPTAHFGLGDETSVDVEIRTPGGQTVRRKGVKKDQTLTIEIP